ncbi:MAG TPA: FkbM family methyltransferase [Rhodocyclaceae bacterium]|nr:FkbM family methyltransferase [Rhodocyclaceae bacterium]
MKRSNLRPAAFVVTSTNHGSMLVNRHDYRLTDHGGYGVGYQLLNTSVFDPSEVDVARQLLEARRKTFGDGVVALDCGANVGVHTIEWAQFMFGWGNVISFEAQERIFYALTGNITLNNCFNARAIWAAVGKENGVIQVPIPDYFTPSSFGSLEIRKRENTEYIGQDVDYGEEKAQTTAMISIDGLNLKRLDFIKIDIEGMEMDALEGARNTIERFKPQLLIEKIKTNEIDLMNFLEPRGYTIFPLGINILAIHKDDPVANQISVS